MCELWMEPPILETRAKGLGFDDLCRSCEKDGDPLTRPAKEIKEIYTITDTKYQNGLLKQIIATTKLTHLRSN